MMNDIELEIFNTEKAFAKLAAEKGLKTAFLTFASDKAVLIRNNKLIKGRKEIEKSFEEQKLVNVKLSWEPEFVRAAASGDIGYTYGPYDFSGEDKDGKIITGKGIFHTIWEKQSDGKWLYVLD